MQQHQTIISINVSTVSTTVDALSDVFLHVHTVHFRYWFWTACQANILNDKVLSHWHFWSVPGQDGAALICVSNTKMWHGEMCRAAYPELKPVKDGPKHARPTLPAGGGDGSAALLFRVRTETNKNAIIVRSIAETHVMHAKHGENSAQLGSLLLIRCYNYTGLIKKGNEGLDRSSDIRRTRITCKSKYTH